MKMLRSAMFAGVCLAAAVASNASASAIFNFAETIGQGEDRTYTLTFGPDLVVTNGMTPYIYLEANAHYTFRYYEFPDGFSDRFTQVYTAQARCFGKLICHSMDSTIGGGLVLDVATTGNVMTIIARNQSYDFDSCSSANNFLCQSRTDPATFYASFQFEGADPEVTYTVQPYAVPEPATWGLMILGFGMVGAAYRRTGALARV